MLKSKSTTSTFFPNNIELTQTSKGQATIRPISLNSLLKGLDLAVWVSLSVLVLLTVSRHEPWADEAQSWLLARDLGWFKLIFGQLRFEGHPGLWHTILWIAIHVFRIPYAAQGYLGATFGIAGLSVLLFHAPFPRLLRYLIAGSFYFLYQYAVIARSYTLLPLLAFVSAYFFRKRRTFAFAVSISLLTHVSIHGAIIAFGLAVAYSLQTWKGLPKLDIFEKKKSIYSAVLYALSVVFLIVVLFPPSEPTVGSTDAASFTLVLHVDKTIWGLLEAIGPIHILSFGVLLIIAVWCYFRRALLTLLLVVGGNALVFGFLRGTLQHVGIMAIALVTVIWSADPVSKTSEENRAVGSVHYAFVAVLFVLFAVQCRWSYVAIRNDWRSQYSGAPDAAAFLKSQNIHSGCIAVNYWATALQPYFDHNIFLNFGNPDAPAFFHNSEAFRKRTSELDPRIANPSCIVVSQAITSPTDLQKLDAFASLLVSKGYSLAHISQGSTFFRDSPGERQVLLIFMHERR